uniref:Uncharacterized protein n=1 Tax=Trichogramma kaykai TaxID=54128 RepID=A0ABD2WQM1_9HYME
MTLTIHEHKQTDSEVKNKVCPSVEDDIRRKEMEKREPLTSTIDKQEAVSNFPNLAADVSNIANELSAMKEELGKKNETIAKLFAANFKLQKLLLRKSSFGEEGKEIQEPSCKKSLLNFYDKNLGKKPDEMLHDQDEIRSNPNENNKIDISDSLKSTINNNDDEDDFDIDENFEPFDPNDFESSEATQSDTSDESVESCRSSELESENEGINEDNENDGNSANLKVLESPKVNQNRCVEKKSEAKINNKTFVVRQSGSNSSDHKTKEPLTRETREKSGAKINSKTSVVRQSGSNSSDHKTKEPPTRETESEYTYENFYYLKTYKKNLYTLYSKKGLLQDIEDGLQYQKYGILEHYKNEENIDMVHLGLGKNIGKLAWDIARSKPKNGFSTDIASILWDRELLKTRCLDDDRPKHPNLKLLTPQKLNLYIALVLKWSKLKTQFKFLTPKQQLDEMKKCTAPLSVLIRNCRKE